MPAPTLNMKSNVLQKAIPIRVARCARRLGFSPCDFQFKNYFCIHLNVFRQHACFGILCSDGSGTLFYTTVTREMSLKCIKHFLERINKGGPRFAEYIGLTLLFLSVRFRAVVRLLCWLILHFPQNISAAC